VPSTPSGVLASVSLPDGLSVSFLKPSSNGGKPITSYRATCSSDTGGVQRTVSAAASPIRVAPLTPGARYRCVVRAVNGDGVGASSVGSPFVSVPGPPSKPYAVTATQVIGPRLRVAFKAPASDGTSAITAFQARCTAEEAPLVSGSGAGSPVITELVAAGLTYRCQVRAVNAYGAGAWSTPSGPLTVARVVSIAAGGNHSCALRADGSVKCWGDNELGALGLGDLEHRGDGPGEMGANLPVVDLGPGVAATAIAGGGYHTCALLVGGSVKCWGFNDQGQLGLGDRDFRGDEPGEMGASLPVVDLGPGVTATAIAAGAVHTCALLAGGTVKCWGENYGQLGLGDISYRGDEPGEMGASLPAVDLGPGVTATAISATAYHTCALLVGGAVKCWGLNFAALGLGDTETRGDEPGEMGANLPTVDLGTGKTAIAISAGGYHTCALLVGGTVKCWGANFYGSLGLGDAEIRGDQPGEMGDNLPPVDIGPGVKVRALAVGWDHSCVILASRALKCWGRNSFGELGLGDTNHRGDQSGEMGANLPTVDLGADMTATAIVADGGAHACALLSGGNVKCWGANWIGALGLGDTEHRGDQPGEMGDNLPPVELGA